MLILLCMGPTMLKTAAPVQIATASTKTAETDSTAVVGGGGSAAGFDPSSKETSRSMPTLPLATVDPLRAAIDPDSDPCTVISAAMDQIQNYYVIPNQDLQNEITNNKMTIMSITSLVIGQGGVTTADQQVALTKANNIYQLDTGKLQSNMAQMNQQLSPYKQQFLNNACI